jgi:hypothetical protein
MTASRPQGVAIAVEDFDAVFATPPCGSVMCGPKVVDLRQLECK